MPHASRPPLVRPAVVHLVVSLSAVALVVALLQTVTVNQVTVALTLLLVVLGAATRFGLWVATATAIAAMLAFNFFFLPPFGSLHIADPQNWIALIVFLVVAVIASHLSAAAEARAREAIAQRQEVTRLFELSRAAEADRQRAELASALLASLSHGLRTPLTAIRVAIRNLEDPALDEDERRAQRHVTITEIDRLDDLFEDVLDMARIDAAAIAAEREYVSPADLVDAAIARAGAILDGRTVRVEAPGDLGADVDPRLTANALAQILENAAKYSPRESAIDVRGWTSGDGLHFTVRDRGIGLVAAERDRLFERFYRGTEARTRASGTGMGLAITRGLLAAQGGRVWGDNAAGGGALFSVVIPAAVRAVTAGQP